MKFNIPTSNLCRNQQQANGAKNVVDSGAVGIPCEVTSYPSASSGTNVHGSVQAGTLACVSNSACVTTNGSADRQSGRLCGEGGD